LVGKPEGKRPLGRPMRRWEDNIKMNLKEVVWDCVVWIYLDHDKAQWWALMDRVMNFPVTQIAGNFLTCY
jgi:hypothetical protein